MMRQKRSKRPSRLTPSPSPSVSSIASSFDLASPDRPFDNILNFRDVGRSVNEYAGNRYEPALRSERVENERSDC